MNDPHQTEQSAAGESASQENSGQEDPPQEHRQEDPPQDQGQEGPPQDPQDQGEEGLAPVHSQDETSEDIANIQPGPGPAQHTEAAGGEDESTEIQGTPAAPQKSNKALLLGLGSGALGLIVGLAIGAFAVPALLSGPGKPDGEASKAVAALASKNAGQMGKVYCHGPNGKPVTQQIPPRDLQLIRSVKQSGPLQRTLDTEAQVPVSLTVSNQGKPQTLPIDMVLGVTNGGWCMKGLAQPQQPQQ